MFLTRLKITLAIFFRFLKVAWQVAHGVWRIKKLSQPIVTIFGGSRLGQAEIYAQKAHDLAHNFAEHGISVLTGGGPGIMQAASCGVTFHQKEQGMTMGIGVTGLREPKNLCVQEYFEVDNFLVRKWLLSEYSVAFIVFPGGFGTLDELGNVLTMIETGQLKKVPIILIGTEYWTPFLKWLKTKTLPHGLITDEYLNLFTLTDDLAETFCLVQNECLIARNQIIKK